MLSPRLHRLIILTLLVAPLRAEVLVVNADGSGDFNTLALAEAAAQDADILLVQGEIVFPHSTVPELLSTSKQITIVGDPGTRPRIGGVIVSGLEAQKSVVLRNLEITPASFLTVPPALSVLDCAGSVVVEDCSLTGVAGFSEFDRDGYPAIVVENSPNVLLSRVVATGGAGVSHAGEPPPFGATGAGNGGPALRVIDGVVAAWGCTLVGGAGGDDLVDGLTGGVGGTGIETAGAELWIEGGAVAGGAGGLGCVSPGACQGGAGAVLDTHDLLRRRDAVVFGGPGGPGGAPGADLVGSHLDYPGAASQTVEVTPVRSNESTTLTVTGAPGAQAVVFLMGGWQPVRLGGNKGVLALKLPLLWPHFLGTLSAGGEAQITFTAPDLTGTIVEHIVIGKQGVLFDGDGLRFAGPTVAVHLGQTP